MRRLDRSFVVFKENLSNHLKNRGFRCILYPSSDSLRYGSPGFTSVWWSASSDRMNSSSPIVFAQHCCSDSVLRLVQPRSQGSLLPALRRAGRREPWERAQCPQAEYEYMWSSYAPIEKIMRQISQHIYITRCTAT